MIEERDYLIILYDFYFELLSDKQKEYFEDYYFNNLSLGEISENTGLSRNAIHKNIKSVSDKLYFYEDKLGLYRKRKELYNIINELDDDIKNRIEKIYQGDIMANKIKNEKKYVMYYDYKKRTNGGIFDAILIVSFIIIISTFIFLYIMEMI